MLTTDEGHTPGSSCKQRKFFKAFIAWVINFFFSETEELSKTTISSACLSLNAVEIVLGASRFRCYHWERLPLHSGN
jgi:hypothetical protein